MKLDQLQSLYKQYAEDIKQLEVEGDLLHPVFGDGVTSADVIFVGEAPGAQEVKEGLPFIGKAGKQLDDLLTEASIDRSRLFVTNAVKYRPTKNDGRANRTPTTNEIRWSRWLLLKEMEIIQPSLVVTLGNSPLFAVTDDLKQKVGSVHGTCQWIHGYNVFSLYHPASIIYNQSLLETYKTDLRLLAQWIDQNIDIDKK